ncbi:hypothetical protein GF407_04775 [candidate division KSB1 bacterium]|nr:hypothetical protein [candidate division KSB1 bacterium]
MMRIRSITLLLLALFLSSSAQLLVKNSSDVTLMQVTNTGHLGVNIGDAAPAATLDVGGDVHIGTVLDLSGTGNASVLVLDNGVVKKRTLLSEIWDGDDGQIYTAGAGINISTGNEISAVDNNATNELQDLGSSKSGESVTVTITGGSNTSFSVRDGDYLTSNETPQSGTATSVSGRAVNVLYDNSTIRLNGTNQLYAVAPTESDPIWNAAKPTTSSTSSGTELAWNGSAFLTRQVLYLRGYIGTQQSFPSGSYDVASLARKVNFDQLYSSDNTNHINSSGEFIVPKTAYYFISATVGVVEDPTAVTLAVFKSTNGGSSWIMDVNGNATPLRIPTTAVMVTGIIHADAGDRLVVGLRNSSGVDCKSVAYDEPTAPVESQNILTIMELP